MPPSSSGQNNQRRVFSPPLSGQPFAAIGRITREIPMYRSSLPILLLLLMCTGCVTTDSKTEVVPPNPFGYSTGRSTVAQTSYSPSSLEAAARVDTLGRKLLVTNPQLGIKPLFRTIGAPDPEVFHHGVTELDITEGLVKQCA